MSDFDKLKEAVSAARNAGAIRDRDFFADECIKLRASLAAAEADAIEQALLVGMGTEREAALLAKLADEVRHADELARACKMVADKLHNFGLTETASVLLSVHSAHAARRAGNAVEREEGRK